MRSGLRPLAFAAAALLFLPCQGCFFTWLVCTAGCRTDVPAITERSRSAILEAYVSRDGSRLALRHRTIALDRYPGCPFLAMGHPMGNGWPGTPGEAWANVDADALSRAVAPELGPASPVGGEASRDRPVKVLPEDCIARCCRWRLKEMRRVEVVEVGPAGPAPDCGCPRLEIRAVTGRGWRAGYAPGMVTADIQVRWLREGPDGEILPEVVFDLPRRDYREPAGYAAFALLPVTVPVDIVCWIPTLVVFAVVR